MGRKRAAKKLISTKLPVEQYETLEAYARQKDISIYEASSELLAYALAEKTGENNDVQAMLDIVKPALKEELNGIVKEEVLKYLKRILYHSFRIDAWQIEYARKVHKDNFADELNQNIEELVAEYNK